MQCAWRVISSRNNINVEGITKAILHTIHLRTFVPNWSIPVHALCMHQLQMYSAVQYYTVTRWITLLNESENSYFLKPICFNHSPDLLTQFMFPCTNASTYEVIRYIQGLAASVTSELCVLGLAAFNESQIWLKDGGVHVQSIKNKLVMNEMTSI